MVTMNLARVFRELRREQRIRTLKSGRVHYFEDLASTDCLIRNLSSGGAKLSFDRPYSGPESFTLRIGIGELVQGSVHCDIKWAKGKEVGVKFRQRQSFILYAQDGDPIDERDGGDATPSISKSTDESYL